MAWSSIMGGGLIHGTTCLSDGVDKGEGMPGEGTAGHGVATAPQLLGGDMPKITPPRLDSGGGGGTIRFPTEFSGAGGSGGKVARGHEGTRPTDFGLAALAATVSGESGGVLDLDLVGEERWSGAGLAR